MSFLSINAVLPVVHNGIAKTVVLDGAGRLSLQNTTLPRFLGGLSRSFGVSVRVGRGRHHHEEAVCLGFDRENLFLRLKMAGTGRGFSYIRLPAVEAVYDGGGRCVLVFGGGVTLPAAWSLATVMEHARRCAALSGLPLSLPVTCPTEEEQAALRAARERAWERVLGMDGPARFRPAASPRLAAMG